MDRKHWKNNHTDPPGCCEHSGQALDVVIDRLHRGPVLAEAHIMATPLIGCWVGKKCRTGAGTLGGDMAATSVIPTFPSSLPTTASARLGTCQKPTSCPQAGHVVDLFYSTSPAVMEVEMLLPWLRCL